MVKESLNEIVLSKCVYKASMYKFNNQQKEEKNIRWKDGDSRNTLYLLNNIIQ